MKKSKVNPMLDLFFMEAKGQLSVLQESLAVLKNDTSNKNELDSLLRASSSLKAASKLASLDAVFKITQAQENFFSLAAKNKIEITKENLSFIQIAIDLVMQLLEEAEDDVESWLEINKDHLSKAQENIDDLTQTDNTEASETKVEQKPKNNTSKKSNTKKRITKKEKTPDSDNSGLADLSMLELFRMEAETQTNTLSNCLLELENSPSNLDIIEQLMRAAHSLKGAARMVGLDAAVTIAHAMEDVFVAAQNEKLEISHDDMNILLICVDMLSASAKATSKDYQTWITENKSHTDELSTALTAIIKGEEIYPLSFNANALSDSEIDDLESDVKSDISVTESTTEDISENNVKVSTQSLNRLQGLSGEALVESRWLSPFSDSLIHVKKRQAELVSTLDRLRDQLFDSNIDVDDYIFELIQSAHHKANHCRDLLTDQLTELESYDRRSNSLSHRLNREVLQARMRPFSDGVQGLQRLVRDLSQSLNKKVTLDIRGLATQVDRDILEKLQAPLNHMLRNAIDHGIESPAERIKAGKKETGTIRLEAMHVAGMLSIIIQDDGCGIDLDNLRNKIISKGLVTSDMAENLSESELLDFMFLPNFSTREAVTETSGRGVGLDVVHSVMQELRGQLRASSTFGEGLKFQFQLPLTLSVIRALMVEINDEPYAFPLAKIDQTVKINRNHIETMEGRQYFTFGNRHIGLISSHQILELKDKHLNDEDEISVVILGDLINSYGVVVDELLGERNLVVHTLDPRLGKIQDISSASLTEDGAPLLIFDVDDLLRSIDIILSGGRLDTLNNKQQKVQSITSKRVLIVDDSITVREVERNLLQSKGYQVEVAVDGMDGWNATRTNEYDLIVSDIDMPRMNGFEFVSKVKNDERFKDIPVIIVSYKDRAEDRQKGMDVGANYYLTKGSFHDESLLEAVVDLIGEA